MLSINTNISSIVITPLLLGEGKGEVIKLTPHPNLPLKGKEPRLLLMSVRGLPVGKGGTL